VAIFGAGLVLRWYSILHLGRFFTVNVAIAADHQLVDTGPYRFVRHPSYTGALLAFIGFALVLRNWASVLMISVPIAFAFLYRISVEERALVQALGERYRAYIKRTKHLIPFVY
jgi:protein-S-isoprenylcysteine O-methyltransferase